MRLGAFGQNPDRLLGELREAPSAIQLAAFREASGLAMPHAQGVFNTITGALACLTAEQRRQSAPLGYLADAPIPLALIEALTGLDEAGTWELLEAGLAQSLWQVEGDALRAHALTLGAIAATNVENALAQTCDRGWRHLIAINTDDPVALRREVAHHERVRQWVRETWGADDGRVLGYTGNLAIGYDTLGRTAEAVALDEETLAIMERVLGPEHPDRLRSRSNLAGGYRALGRTAEAVALDQETLAIMERVLGPEHPDTLGSRSNLASGYRSLGRTVEAVALDQETMAIMERVLGPEHPDTLKSRGNLAGGYWQLGRQSDSNRLDEETLASRERALGPEHPDTLTSRNNLAVGYEGTGRLDDAIRLYQAALDGRDRVLGPQHPDTQQTRRNLVGALRKAVREDKAARLETADG